MKAVNRNNVWLPNIFENLFFDNRLDVPNNYETFSNPKVNIIENNSNFVLEFAVPGMKKENFTIEVEKEVLTLSAKSITDEKSESKEEDDFKFRRREFNYKEFKRSFKLPEKINTDDIKASYTDGILRITLPKVEEEIESKKMVEIS